MSKDELKKINNIEITYDCWKKIKILSVQNDVTITAQASELLQNICRNKKVNVMSDGSE